MTRTTFRDRQASILPSQALKGASVAIVGLGTLGSWTALALAKMGVPKLTLWDGDHIEEHNAPLQFYLRTAAGLPKAQTLANSLRGHGARGITVRPMWNGDPIAAQVIVSAVDQWDLRRRLFMEAPLRARTTHFIDLRAGREALLIYVANLSNVLHHHAYLDSLSRTPLALDCHEQGIVYVGMRAGAEVAALVAGILRNQPVPFRQLVNLNLFDTEVMHQPR